MVSFHGCCLLYIILHLGFTLRELYLVVWKMNMVKILLSFEVYEILQYYWYGEYWFLIKVLVSLPPVKMAGTMIPLRTSLSVLLRYSGILD